MSIFLVAPRASLVASRGFGHIGRQQLRASTSRVTMWTQTARRPQPSQMHSLTRVNRLSPYSGSQRTRLGGAVPRREFSTGLGAALVAGAGLVAGAISYVFDRFKPVEMPASVMSTFGYDPENAPECPILTTPSIELVHQTVDRLALREGDSFAGVVNTEKLGAKDAHFYLYVSRVGNLTEISVATGIPIEVLEARVTSPLGMMATWAGCMMAGGGAITLNSEGMQLLKQLAQEETSIPRPFARGELTSGYDHVELSDAQSRGNGSAWLTTFQASTMYCHSLSGTVLHGCYVSPNKDVYWLWCGAGGRGFNSRHVNNIAAIHMDLGMWPDMAASIREFYKTPEMVKAFARAAPEDMERFTQQLVGSTTAAKGTFRDILQRLQVSLGYPTRIYSTVKGGGMYGVKGRGTRTDGGEDI